MSARSTIEGMRVVPTPERAKVAETRHVIAPDGTTLKVRRLVDKQGSRWVAEVPIEVAVEIYAAD